MKTRDEFIKSVWEKSETALAEKAPSRSEKTIKRKRILKWSAAAAACLVIAVSAGGRGSMINTGTDGFMPEKYEADGADTAGTLNITDTEGKASAAEPEDQTKLTMPDEGEDNASGEYSFGSGGSQLYMLPAEIVLENLEEGGRTEITGENIAEYMDWFYNLPDEMKLTTEEYEEEYRKAESESTVRYRFTMDFSQGEDKEGVDRVFYILDGVELP